MLRPAKGYRSKWDLRNSRTLQLFSKGMLELQAPTTKGMLELQAPTTKGMLESQAPTAKGTLELNKMVS